ncbi:MAG: guanylate kinase [Planctomycetota bacterium]|jgi:guanylate kinase|nr:guanylate kinase [Planctomycetota bacterium]
MTEQDGLLLVVSGPAGSGKSTLVDKIIVADPTIRRAVTATTRPPRPGEKDGVDYFFLDRQEFTRRIDNGEFLEYTSFNHNNYGTPSRELAANLHHGGVVVLVIEVEGAAALKKAFPQALLVFILPPTRESLRHRLEGRGTESPADIEKRLVIADTEISKIENYHFLIANDNPEAAAADLGGIVKLARRFWINPGEAERWLKGYYAAWHSQPEA